MTRREQFEIAFLDGADRANVLVSSQLTIGADGEYFNANTRALFKFYSLGFAEGLAEVLPEDGPEPEAPAPAPGTHTCDWLGPPLLNGGETCSVCGEPYEFPF